MPASPSASAEGPVRLVVQSEGTEVQEQLRIISLTVRHALNSLPWARLVIDDGDMPGNKYPVSDGALFTPGSAIVLRAGYGDSDAQIFSGIVVRHSLKISGDNHSRLIVECRDKACKMAIGRVNAKYQDQTDSDIISGLIAAAGLQADVQSTEVQQAELLQYDCSDWDFMLARADAMGLLVAVEDGKITVKPPDASIEPALSVTWGVDLVALQADIDARSQLKAAQAHAWDPAQQAVVESSAAAPLALNAQGNLSGATLAQVVSPDSYRLQSSAALPQAALEQWAKAAQMKAALARVRGRMSFQGSALAKPATLIALAGVGARVNGPVFVSAVQHEIHDGEWLSEAEFGLDPDWHMQRPDVMAPPAGGLLPGIHDLQIGVVMKLDADPGGEQRIQVKLPVLQTATEGIWARLLQLHASSGFGAFFLPEVGDEVIVGFLSGDPSHPVVLGSLYSSSRNPPYELAAENDTKALVTRCKHRLVFDEKDKIITLTTPANNQIVLDDKNKSILIKDQNGNSIKLSSEGIALDSPKDIKLTAKGGITLDAVNAIELTSKADIKAAGLNISCEAQVGITAKGAATAELSASGQTTVKGAMVMIN
ncbi:type VI secretion system tip protein VgrG [Paucibacter sp. PLA-PC-4]|uniref:type VI secretion system tip protein VgrG n=1 Tax=Paucibacter sp. PLA-PC-4 TaxID=2993655 RepID=UPI002248D238|nr:type VI secretion system tip protein VgrG [Paucibacter sp. PLA-PC-4]MCX2863298.1 type VI secretion system tip protein VgrG [Paucibacter sp. PLA-PC-4]